MRIVTWNVNSLNARLERVEEWIELNGPDVLCLQETKQADEKFPYGAFEALGYTAVHNGTGRWNGVAILSKVGLEDPQVVFDKAEIDAEPRLVAATCGGVRVLCAYVPNGRALDDDHYRFKLGWLDELAEVLDAQGPEAEAVVLGDFNIAPSAADVWDEAALEGMTHVSEAERAKLHALEALGYEDAFKRFHPDGGIFSWWDYRGGAFHKDHGMRIDLIYTSPALSTRLRGASLDREARKTRPSRSSGEDLKPSDHIPVTVEID
jgi:exodeoxyribonuclease-3